jgi:hypothetical protein
VRALRITRSDLHEQMAEDAALAHHFVSRIASRLHVMADDLRQIDGSLSRSTSVLDKRIAASIARDVPSGTGHPVIH